jgi:imidazolonepropionase-like amidohydrolase
VDLHVRGVVLPDDEERDLWIRDGFLTEEPVPGAETVADRGWIVPGLVDCHCHIGLGPHGAGLTDPEDVRAQAYTDRDAGALLVRDAGVPVDNTWLDGDPAAPRIVHAGQHLARYKRYMPGLGIDVEPDGLVDAVAKQAKRGGGWVKLVGDWIDRSVGDLAPLWPAPALAAAVARAHELGARVAVHAFGEEALPDLIAAGVDSLEHGTGLTGDLLDEVARRGIAVVPTLLNLENFPGIAEGAGRFPVYAARMRRLYGSAHDRLRAALDAGVPMYCGTDAGSMIRHGMVADEIRAMHALGLPAADALAAGSWAAREWLGLPGLVPGAPADLVVYDTDPRADLRVLDAPARIVLRGAVIA